MGNKRVAVEEIRNITRMLKEAVSKGNMPPHRIGIAKRVLDEKLELLKIKSLPLGSFFIDVPVEGKPYPNEHACRLKDPDDFERFARKNCFRRVANKCLDFIFGIKSNKAVVQAYRYKLSANWTAAAARAHCRRAGGKFEAASGEGKQDTGFETKFSGSPRNPFGSHCSFQFKGGISGYRKAWRLHFSQINGGALSAGASGPIRGTVRRVAMIAAAMKPACKVVESDGIGARTGAKSPLSGSYPEKPSDYGLTKWKKPSDENIDPPEKATQFTCSDLNIIKRAATAEIKRRIKDREKEGKEGAVSLEGSMVFDNLMNNLFDKAKKKFDCECIECGWKVKSTKHCRDLKCKKCGGEMRREDRPGPGKEED